EHPGRRVEEQVTVDVVPPVTRVEGPVEALPVLGVAHGRPDGDDVLLGQVGQRRATGPDGRRVEATPVERDLVDLLGGDVQEGGLPRAGAPKADRGARAEGAPALLVSPGEVQV